MKELELGTIIAVFQEMLGAWLIVTVALAALAIFAFAWVLIRDRGIVPVRLVWSEVAGVGGGIVAVRIMHAVTHSGLGDIGGPIDWVLTAAIFLLGAAGSTVGTYALMGLVRRASS